MANSYYYSIVMSIWRVAWGVRFVKCKDLWNAEVNAEYGMPPREVTHTVYHYKSRRFFSCLWAPMRNENIVMKLNWSSGGGNTAILSWHSIPYFLRQNNRQKIYSLKFGGEHLAHLQLVLRLINLQASIFTLTSLWRYAKIPCKTSSLVYLFVIWRSCWFLSSIPNIFLVFFD